MPGRATRGLWLRAALLLLAVFAAVSPFPPTFIESVYSTGVYPVLQPLITSASNLAPFALFDALIGLTLAAWLLTVGLDIRRAHGSWIRGIGTIVLRTLCWMATLYLAFLVVWGLNYRRMKLIDRLEYEPRAVSTESARMLAITAADQLNALYGPAHGEGWPSSGLIDASLARAARQVQDELGLVATGVVARPKATLLDPYFRRAGITGMTDPYFLETLVARDLLPFERPFVVAHEWGHLEGFADESEASFVGWLTCLRSSRPDQYSGWLFLYDELTDAMSDAERRAADAHLEAGPRADRQAIVERVRLQVNRRLSEAGLKVYDRYLKANRIEAGAASYGEVVRLVLGVRFGPGWTPQRARPADRQGANGYPIGVIARSSDSRGSLP